MRVELRFVSFSCRSESCLPLLPTLLRGLSDRYRLTNLERARFGKDIHQKLGRLICSIWSDEIADLWRVVFPEDRNIYWDEEDNALRHRDRPLNYAEQ